MREAETPSISKHVPVVSYDGQLESINRVELDSTNMRSRTPRGFRAAKRAIDLVVALTGLTLGAPIILLMLCIVPYVSPGGPIFTQRRIGRRGLTFPMHKIRTMHVGSHHSFIPRTRKERLDPRVFKIGAFLRKTSLDELPNLINVLRGEMSIVGPRPMLPEEVVLCISRHGKAVSDYRLSVKPGLTGLWQISGRAGLDFDERVALDVRYAQSWSPVADLIIILKTVPSLLRARGAF